jgi:hypothetical protein
MRIVRRRHDQRTLRSSGVRLVPEIITGMQQLAVEQRRLLGRRAQWHVGDIAWGLREHEGRESEWKIRLWVEDGRVSAWSWLKSDGGRLEHEVHPEHRHLLDKILAEPAATLAFALEDDEPTRTALERHGLTLQRVLCTSRLASGCTPRSGVRTTTGSAHRPRMNAVAPASALEAAARRR